MTVMVQDIYNPSKNGLEQDCVKDIMVQDIYSTPTNCLKIAFAVVMVYDIDSTSKRTLQLCNQSQISNNPAS